MMAASAKNVNRRLDGAALRLPASGMDLEKTLFCGQAFVWRALPDGWFAGVAGSRAVLAAQQGDALYLRGPDGKPLGAADAAFWADYFALDMDYAALEAAWAAHPQLAPCLACGGGIRVLRQPFWDALVCFILSQNNNIARITGIVQGLRRAHGPRLPGGQYGIPAPKTLAALQPGDLAPLRMGYRAKYLLDAARRVAAGEVTEEKLRALDDEAARQLLCTIHGVGAKVADCVLLYGLARWDVVPMDVWMKRACAGLFPGGFPECAAGSRGIAQQYIFEWARKNLPRGG